MNQSNMSSAIKRPPRPKINATAGLEKGDLPPRKRLEVIYGGEEPPQSRNDPQF